MILHTICSYEQIFPPSAAPGSDSPELSASKTSEIDGGFIETTQINGKNVINRIISTDLRIYLKPELLPGIPYNF